MNLVLIGAPGSGKDTLANKIKDYNYYILSPGDLYRNEVNTGSQLGIEAQKYWSQGLLCPDDMTNTLMSLNITALTPASNILFNGFPRTLKQAEFLDKLVNIDVVIKLETREEVLINRLLKRGRVDDSEAVIQQRISVYNDNIREIEDYYKASNKFEIVSSEDSPQETFKKAWSLILDKQRR